MVYGPKRCNYEKAGKPSRPARNELLHKPIYHISLQLDTEVVHQAEEACNLGQTYHHIVACIAMLHLENDDIGKQDAIHVYVMPTSPESERFSIFQSRILTSPETD